jgi:hypothetical protein
MSEVLTFSIFLQIVYEDKQKLLTMQAIPIIMSLMASFITIKEKIVNAGYARVKILSNSVHLRFERIDQSGASGAFDALRDKLYHEIPEAKWDHSVRWMTMPRGKLNQALGFCYRELGVGRVKIEDHHASEGNRQPPLGF